MKKNLFAKRLIFILLIMLLVNFEASAQEQIVFSWVVEKNIEKDIKVYATVGTNTVLVNWGDGSEEYYSTGNDYTELAHIYSSDNIFEVKIESANLFHLLCENRQLISLDISNAPELTYLICISNELTELDLSGNPKLFYLICSDNKLSSLDVSANPALEYLFCWSNKLTSLNISSNVSLTNFYCYDNLIPMSGIKDISDNFSGIAHIGTQTLIEIPYSEENNAYTFDDAFNGEGTLFEVILNDTEAIEDEDYVINGGDITFLKQGMYIVTVSNSHIISASEHTAKVTASINNYLGIDDKEESKLYIYPNPVKNKFYVNNNVDEQVIIYNIQGKTVLKTYNSEVDISDLDSGIYFVNIGQQNFKVIKE